MVRTRWKRQICFIETVLRSDHEIHEKYPEIYKVVPADTHATRKKPKSQPNGERPKVVRVPLNSRAKTLVEKYAGRDDLNGKLFPFISSQKYNVAIKKIFTICGVDRMVTVLNPTTGAEEKRPINEIASNYLARRTFIVSLYKKVKAPNLVSTLSGHRDSSKAFARYRDIDEDMKKELVNLLD